MAKSNVLPEERKILMPSAEKLMETPESRFVGLFIGRSGGGKTSALCSFPRPMVILDLDGRIRGGLSNSWIDPKGIDFEVYPMKGGRQATYEKLQKDLEMIMAKQGMPGVQQYKTLVLDSLTFETIAVLLDAIPLTHQDSKGKKMGSLDMAGVAEYGFQSQFTYQVLAFLKSIQIQNVIATAHIVPKYGKAPGSSEYAANVIVGEQLNMTDKLAEVVPAYFDHIYRFKKVENGPRTQHFVKTSGELERTGFRSLPIEADITGKDFYQWMIQETRQEAKK